MQGDEKNLKDLVNNSPVPYQTSLSDISFSISYTKTNKLITALYMVTDIIDDREPIRHKLRTLGTEIISDIYAISTLLTANGSMRASSKIAETLSFLDIASTMNIISIMNCNILKKEFLELQKSIVDSVNKTNYFNKSTDLSEFFREPAKAAMEDRGREFNSKGHTRIGVQKGSTLMKALSDKTSYMSDIKNVRLESNNFDNLKKERRAEIVSIIKNSSNDLGDLGEYAGATITDIKTKAKGALASCGEKTLQRELVSMVKDNVLYKTGEKRWSRYFISK